MKATLFKKKFLWFFENFIDIVQLQQVLGQVY